VELILALTHAVRPASADEVTDSSDLMMSTLEFRLVIAPKLVLIDARVDTKLVFTLAMAPSPVHPTN
jgi:hypothetical protein